MKIPRKGSTGYAVLTRLNELGQVSVASLVQQRVFNQRSKADLELESMKRSGMIVFIDDDTIRMSSTMQKFYDDTAKIEPAKGAVLASPYHPPFKPLQPCNMMNLQARRNDALPPQVHGYKSSGTAPEPKWGV